MMWQSFRAIGRGISEKVWRKKTSGAEHKPVRNGGSGRPKNALETIICYEEVIRPKPREKNWSYTNTIRNYYIYCMERNAIRQIIRMKYYSKQCRHPTHRILSVRFAATEND